MREIFRELIRQASWRFEKCFKFAGLGFLGLFLGLLNLGAFPFYAPPGGGAPPSGGTQNNQSTQSALQIFSGVNAASFLKKDDSDFVGFGGPSVDAKQSFSVDLSDHPLEQSAIDTQIEGDWNNE